MTETPDTVHGRLLEAVHISGYTMERACGELKWLLDKDRWKSCGRGYKHIDAFLATIDLKEFRIAVDQRKQLVKQLTALRATQRPIAKALGVGKTTVVYDNKSDGHKRPNQRPKDPIGGESDPPTGHNGPEWFQRDVDPSREAKRIAGRDERQQEKTANRAAAAVAAKDAIGDAETLSILDGPFQSVAANLADASVDLVFTDPPYHDKTLPLYSELGTVAARVLKDGASLIMYTSHHRIPEVIAMLQSAGLSFFWPIAMVHTGQAARMTEYGIVVRWKPLLWFVKGTFRRRDNMRFLDDLVMSTPEKDAHPWQQSEVEARYYVEALTEPGELVFDPFCGGGTTAVAAARAVRRWLTCDVDLDSVYLARQRLHEALGVA